MKQIDQAADHYSRVMLGLGMLSAVLLVGTAGYMLIEGWSLLDAFYMSAITITTVGYREVEPLSDKGKLFTIGLLFFGVGAAFYILTALVAAIIEGDLRQIFGARRMTAAVERLRDHYIVCGYGRVGAEVADDLMQRGAPFVILDLNAEAVDRARGRGMLTIHGDATADEALQRAGISHCRAVIAASDSDATNTYITLTARALRTDVFIVARISTPQVESKLRQAGANRVVSPYSIGGRRLALAAMQPLMADFIDIVPGQQSEGRIVAEFVIDEASGMAGQQLSEALQDCRDVVVLAVREESGRMNVGPPGATRLSPGDRLLLAGDEGELSRIVAFGPKQRR